MMDLDTYMLCGQKQARGSSYLARLARQQGPKCNSCKGGNGLGVGFMKSAMQITSMSLKCN